MVIFVYIQFSYMVQAMTKTLEDYKNEMLGKTFGWLTVLDVFRDEQTHSRICRCRCKCGNIVIKDMRKVYKGHTTSCGCYVHSKEKSDVLKGFWKNNPEARKRQSEVCKKAYEDNPELRQLLSEKQKKFLEEHPERVEDMVNNYKRWCKENPERLKELGRQHSEYLLSHPEVTSAATEKTTQFYADHPEKMIEKTEKRKQTLKNNPEIQINIGKRYSSWCKENPDRVRDIAEKNSIFYKNKRTQADFSAIIDYIHPSQVEDLLNGTLDSQDSILTKCPKCGDYSYHVIHNMFRYNNGTLKLESMPMCKKCYEEATITTSKYEQIIADYVSTFYNGKCVHNTRDIIYPRELDLYYPKKKIAIEFNGDYWHNNDHKSRDYHYNKFKQCRDLGITLVSIFESDWNSREQEIKDYLKDLFNGKENKLSFKENYMNNNFPSPISNISDNHIEENYTSGDYTIYTCGCSEIV